VTRLQQNSRFGLACWLAFFPFTLLGNHAFALEIQSISSAGSGCKANGKVAADASENNINIYMPELKADNLKTKRLFRSNCNLSIALSSSGGKQFRTKALNTEYNTAGTATDDLSANFKLWFQGESKTVSINHKINTSKGQPIQKSIDLPIEEEMWSSCKKEHILNVGVSFIGKNKDGFSSEYSFKQPRGLKVDLTWRPCS